MLVIILNVVSNATKKYKKILKSELLVKLLIIISVMLFWGWMPFIQASRLVKPPIIGITLATIVYALFVFVCYKFFFFCYKKLNHLYEKWRFPDWQLIFIIFIVVAGVEMFVAWLVTVVWIGEGSSLDTALPFASFTPFLMYTPFGLLARFVGYHGVSAAFVTLIAVFNAKKFRKYRLVSLVLVLVLILLSWFIYLDTPAKTLKTHIVAESLDNQVPQIKTNAELVVIPEYGLDFIVDKNIDNRIEINPEKETYFVGSKQGQNTEGVVNTLVYGSTKQGFIRTQNKPRLIPAGEYLPYLIEVPLRTLGFDEQIIDFELTRKITKGDEPSQPFKISEGVVVGTELCSSIIAPSDYRRITNEGATVLINSASLKVFRSPVFDLQHKGLAKFMAIANSRPFLQSANTSDAFAIDHNGQILKEISPINSTDVSIKTNQSKTVYTVFGEWPAYIGIALILYAYLKQVAQRKKKIQ